MSGNIKDAGGEERNLPPSQQLYASAEHKIAVIKNDIHTYYKDNGWEVPSEIVRFLGGGVNNSPVFFLDETPIKLEIGIMGADKIWPSTIVQDSRDGIIGLCVYLVDEGGKLINPLRKINPLDESKQEPPGTGPTMVVLPKEGPAYWVAYIDLVTAEDLDRMPGAEMFDQPFMPRISTFQKILHKESERAGYEIMSQVTENKFSDEQCRELSRILQLLRVDIDETLVQNGLGDYRVIE